MQVRQAKQQERLALRTKLDQKIQNKKPKKKAKRIRTVSTSGYSADQCLRLVKAFAVRNFNESVEIAVELNLEPKRPEQSIRALASLPFGTGKEETVCVFAKGEKAEQALAAGASMIGDEAMVQRILEGDIPFTKCLATPDMMGMVGKIARVLGPRGLMPNPKTGTLTMDVAKAVQDAKAGQIDIRTDPTGVVRGLIGKVDFTDDALRGNLQSFMEAIYHNKPSGAKGHYLCGVAISSSMGPGFRIQISDDNLVNKKKRIGAL